MKEELEMFVNNKAEEDFLFKHLSQKDYVLEFGSGMSTLAIAKRVKKMVSIEHNEQYYNSTKKLLEENGITNCQLIHVPQNAEPKPEYDDGTFEDFKDYVLAPLKIAAMERFSVVFIDGRARAACAMYAEAYYLKKDGLIFIHDYRHPQPEYRRREYEVVEEYLAAVEGEFAMWKLKRISDLPKSE